MESHLEGCETCRSSLAAYEKLSLALHRGEENLFAGIVSASVRRGPETEAARLRIWPQGGFRALGKPRLNGVFRKKVQLSLPGAAAAAVVIAAFTVFTLRVWSPGPRLGQLANSMSLGGEPAAAQSVALDNTFGIESSAFKDAASISDVLKMLDSAAAGGFVDGQGGEYLIMRLPENKNFSNLGTPQLVPASAWAAGGNGPKK
jgi:hypothetical protein